jgi:F420-0:gamma-glutamyl ligase
MNIEPIKTRIFREGESLLQFIEEYIPIFENGDVLVVTSKIVALAEGRTFVAHTEDEKLEYVKSESSWYARTKYVHLTIHDRMPMANAGIDESNGNGRCIMLPKDSYLSAYEIWLYIKEKYQLANFGIIITDSRTIPFRNGTTGVSLGHAGFDGIRDYRGRPDIFGRTFHYARTNVPDALATAAVHVMGEWDECQPLAMIKDAKVVYSNLKQNGNDLIIDPEDDMYAPLFQSI